MIMPTTDSCDVLIVGYGPVGATLAGLLAERGMDVIVIDRASDVYPLPRAAHFDHEIMRVFQQLGIAEAVLDHARPAGAYEFRAADGRLLLSAPQGPGPSVSGWSNAYMFNQPGVERLLRAKISEHANVNVRLKREFMSLTQSEHHVDVSVSAPVGEEVIRARYVVGCDGAWSPVREAVGITLEDFEFDEPWLVVDTIPVDPETMPKVNLQICDPARPTTCVMMGPGRHRWEFMLLPGETREAALSERFVEQLLEKWNVDVAIERKAVYRFHALVAHAWRKDRVLIAGDAAHQMPPFAGQGMCSGIRDAVNLAWKLQAIIHDDADPMLLDTYQAERDPHVRSYIQLAIEMGRMVCTLDPKVAEQRDATMIAMLESGNQPTPHVVKLGLKGGAMLQGDPIAADIFPQFVSKSSNGVIRLDDVLGRDAWLVETGAEGRSNAKGLLCASISDQALVPFRAELDAWFEKHQVDAVLVRPDRYIFGTGEALWLQDAWTGAIHPNSAEVAV